MSLVSHAELATFYNLKKKTNFSSVFVLCHRQSQRQRFLVIMNWLWRAVATSIWRVWQVKYPILHPLFTGTKVEEVKTLTENCFLWTIYIYPIHSIYYSVINYSLRGGISVNTDRNTKTSKLLIAKATYGKILVDISKNGRNPNKIASFSPFCLYSQAIAATTLALRRILVRHIFIYSLGRSVY